MATTMMDDQSVAQRVLDHIANRTTDIGQKRLARTGRELSVARLGWPRDRAGVCDARRRRSVRRPRCPRPAPTSRAKPPARRSSSCAAPTARCAPSAMPAAIAACRWPAARAAARRSSAATTAGPTISKAGCGTFRTRKASPASTRRPIRWCRCTARERLGLVFVTQSEPMPGDDSLDGLDRLIAPGSTPVRDGRARLRGQLEDPARGLHRGLPHQVDPPREFPALRLRQSERHRPLRPQQPRHLSVPAHQEAGEGAAAGAPGRRAADLRLPPVPQRADHRAVAPHQRRDPGAAGDRSHPADHLHADQRRRRRSRGAGRSQTRRRLRRQRRSRRRTAPWCRRSSAASAAAPTRPSPSGSSRAPSSTSIRP